eukprot:2479555-Rhodomonas_salina.1
MQRFRPARSARRQTATAHHTHHSPPHRASTQSIRASEHQSIRVSEYQSTRASERAVCLALHHKKTTRALVKLGCLRCSRTQASSRGS